MAMVAVVELPTLLERASMTPLAAVVTGALIVEVVMIASRPSTVRPGAVSVPPKTRSESPTGIVYALVRLEPVLKSKRVRAVAGVMVSATLVSDSVAASPTRVPAERSRAPPVTVSVRPAASVMLPVFVKLGVVPVCAMPKFCVVSAIVPLLRCAALALLSVSGCVSRSVPRLSSCAASVWLPVPGTLTICPVKSLTSAPLVTARVVVYPPSLVLISTSPEFAMPTAAVSVTLPPALLERTDNVPAAPTFTGVLSVEVAVTFTRPSIPKAPTPETLTPAKFAMAPARTTSESETEMVRPVACSVCVPVPPPSTTRKPVKFTSIVTV